MLLLNVTSLLENDSQQPQVSFRAHSDLGSYDDECVVSISSYGNLLVTATKRGEVKLWAGASLVGKLGEEVHSDQIIKLIS